MKTILFKGYNFNVNFDAEGIILIDFFDMRTAGFVLWQLYDCCRREMDLSWSADECVAKANARNDIADDDALKIIIFYC